MSTRYEGASADASVSWLGPGDEIGEDTLRPGRYALVISYDEVFYIEDTADKLRRFMVRLDQELQHIEAHAAAPLTLADYKPDEDGNYPCTRCDTLFETRDYEDLAALIGSINMHIETDHPAGHTS